ncbi:MAG: SagB/ThcOx family dehydrogenase [Thermoproteales archaeon]|nr:SagB/ThcOx family dehydrogenase [Thermoproteales archaeon]
MKMELPVFTPESEETLSSLTSRLAFWRSVSYTEVSKDMLARILFSINGVTRVTIGRAFKSIPSAGATYPLEIYFVSQGIDSLEDGVYYYYSEHPGRGTIYRLAGRSLVTEMGDLLKDSFKESFQEAALTVIISPVFSRTTSVYGERGYHYVYMEVGHAIQNACLEATLYDLAFTYTLDVKNIGQVLSKKASFKGTPVALISFGRGKEPVKPFPEPLFTVKGREYVLPMFEIPGEKSFEESLLARRSIRNFSKDPLKVEELAYILRFSLGFTAKETHPYLPPDNIYRTENIVFVSNVENLRAGKYHYDPTRHSITLISEGDYRGDLWMSALMQNWIKDASSNIVIVSKKGVRDRMLADVECGMVGELIYLAATSIGLGTVAIGAFIDRMVEKVLKIPGTQPLYIMPVSHPSGREKRFFGL